MSQRLFAAVRNPARLAALRRLALLDNIADPAFDRLTRMVAHVLGVPIVLITVVDADRQFFKSCLGLAEPWASWRETPLSHSFCQHVVDSSQPLIIADAREHPLVSDNLAIPDLGVIAYAGIPLTTADGFTIGSLCAIDRIPRDWSQDELDLLGDFAATVLTDIELRAELSEHQRTEEALRVSEARYRVIFEQAPFCISMCDSEGTIIFANQALLSVYGISNPRQFVGHYNISDILTSAQPALADHFKRAWAGETVRYHQTLDLLTAPYRTKRSDTLYLDTTLFPVPGGEGQRPYIVIIQEDITGRMQAEQARLASEERLRIAIAAARMGVWDWDLRSSVVTWAGNQEDLFGLAAGSFRGTYQAFIDCVHPEDHALVTHALDRALQERIPYDCIFRIVWPNNSLHWMAGMGEVIWDSDNNPVRLIGVNMDITEHKQAEATLIEREELYRLITENSNDLILLIDQNGQFIYASPSFNLILGYQPSTLIGSSVFEFIHPDDQAAAQAQWASTIATGSGQITMRYRHASGDWCWLEASSTVILRQKLAYLVGVARDITERRRLEAQIIQAQKVESIGRLAGGIAHDFNNILTAITGYVGLAQDTLPEENPARSDLAEVQKAAQRAATLTSQLLAFARKQNIEPRVINLNTLILDMDKLLRRILGENVDLITRTAANLGHVKVDPGQIEQVIVNLAVNGRDAMPTGGRLTIETRDVVLDGIYARGHVNVPEGTYVLLTVSDTGIGIHAEIQRHLFEPFFTTKEQGKGTGLGLATCYGIIKQHGGFIWVYSEVGLGTTIKVYLPRVDAVAEALPDQVEQAEHPHGSETVLLVEDEQSVRRFAARVLQEHGYNVLDAANGTEALKQVQRMQEPIQLLVTDMIMPQMGGQVLSERLSALIPDIPILFMSGYTDNTLMHQGILTAGVAFLPKPFSAGALLRKVRETLDRDTPHVKQR